MDKLKMRTFLKHINIPMILVVIVAIVPGILNIGCSPKTDERPNVILIVTDDQGYGDMGYHGNKTIKTPHYDFKTGIRHLNIHELLLLKKEILLIDSLHGLHENMTHSIPDESKFRVYIETLGQFKTEAGTFMRWADNRLLRRMIRDKHHRNLKPMETLTHWHYVRRSEFANIIPFVNKSNVIINSALPYELPILKHRLFRYIAASIHRYENDPYRLDAHIRANRVYELLKPIKVVSNTSCLPRDSLLREFVGGSKYKY